jgi:ketosteroid isomerase-like protein
MTQATVEFASEVVRRETLALDAANRYYDALNRMFTGDLAAMESIWSQAPETTLMGPFGGRQIGYPEVMRTFQRDRDLKSGGRVTPRDLLIRLGEELAYSVGIEHGEIATSTKQAITVDIRATNIFKLEDNDWKLVYHHTDTLPSMQQASAFRVDEFSTPKGPPPAKEILNLLDQFYSAVQSMFSGNLKPLGEVWSKTDDASFASPVGNIQIGWPAIRNEFELHSKLSLRGNLRFDDPIIHLAGDLAYASCKTLVPDMIVNGKPYNMNVRATHIFRRTGRHWRLVHNHNDVAPGLAELVGTPPK